jgi:integrase
MITKIGIYKDVRNKARPWTCRWFTVVDPETGKRKRFGKSFEFKRDAERFRSEKAVEFGKQGRPRANPQEQALDTFLKSWLRRQKPELKPASLELYEGTVKRLVDFFGRDKCLHDITMELAQDFMLAQKNRTIGRKGDDLSPWTREQLKRHCKTIFGAAVELGYLPKNPFTAKLLRSKRLATKRWYRMKADEYHALLEITPSLREKVAYAMFYTAGLRMHEAFNVTWDCVDFQKNILQVMNREATANMPPFSIKDHEERRIPLPPDTIALLAQWQTEAPEGVPFVLLTKERYERVKAKWRTLRGKGLPWKNRYVVNNVLRNFKGHVIRADIKPVGKFTIHTLRKCCGQNWADYLPMNVVKELLGHSSISTTAEFYSTVDRDHEKKAARVVQELLDRNKNDVSVTYETENRQIGGKQ